MKAALALARPEIRTLAPYSHAVWQPTFRRLHANEVPWRAAADGTGGGLNRYPEPQPRLLVERLAALYGVAPANVLVTHGSDESIDVLSRVYLRAGVDAVLQVVPTFAMYAHAARIQGAGVVEVPLSREGWRLDAEAVLEAWNPSVKIVYLCSPNNPTGNDFDPGAIEAVIAALDGRAIVVLDEAYVEWSGRASRAAWLSRYETLVVLRTLSKAYALAGARVGALIASAEIVELMRRVVPPYALAGPSIEVALRALEPRELEVTAERVRALLAEREFLEEGLLRCRDVERVWPSAANFLLVECRDADRFLENALAGGCLVRDVRAMHPSLANAVRVSVGAREDHAALLECLGGGCAWQQSGTGSVERIAGGGAEGGSAARRARRERRTAETFVSVAVDLSRQGPSQVASGLGFFDHMLEQLAKHGGFALELACRGDLRVDEHHTVEDCALTLGAAMREALGEKRGIARYGFVLPMDEAEAQVALDLSGRSFFVWEGQFGRERVGDLPTELVPHFFRSFADALGATLHVRVRGENCHHMIEACFKAVGRSLRQAIRQEGGREGAEVPSTKGVL